MPKITALPHPEYALYDAAIKSNGTTTLCDALLAYGIDIEHACGKVGACNRNPAYPARRLPTEMTLSWTFPGIGSIMRRKMLE